MRPRRFVAAVALALSSAACDSAPPKPEASAHVAAAPPSASSAAPRESASAPPSPGPSDAAPAIDATTAADAATAADASSDAPATRAATDAGPPVAYASYTSDKWGFTVDYPTLFSRKMATGPGQHFYLPGNPTKAEFYAWGTPYPTTPVKSLYEDWTRRPLTFKELTGNSFVVRGKEGAMLFYSKSTLEHGILTTLYFEYAPDLADWIEPIILHANESLKLVPLGYRKNKMK